MTINIPDKKVQAVFHKLLKDEGINKKPTLTKIDYRNIADAMENRIATGDVSEPLESFITDAIWDTIDVDGYEETEISHLSIYRS